MSEDADDVLRTPCLCHALRQASRSVTRLYDEEMREIGLRTTQFTLMNVLALAGELRQGELGEKLSIDETTLTRNLRPLILEGWVAARPGQDRREKRICITDGGREKLRQARPAWRRAQKRMKDMLPNGLWKTLLQSLPDVSRVVAENQ